MESGIPANATEDEPVDGVLVSTACWFRPHVRVDRDVVMPTRVAVWLGRQVICSRSRQTSQTQGPRMMCCRRNVVRTANSTYASGARTDGQKCAGPVKNYCFASTVSRETRLSNTVSRETLLSNTVSRETLLSNTVSRETLLSNTVSRETHLSNTVSRETRLLNIE